MKRIIKIGLLLAFICGTIYLSPPLPEFPKPPKDSLVSNEPADLESIYRKSYFTNLTRDEIMNYYDKEFKGWISFRLDQRREDAYSVIRDQTPSSYIEEIVQPGRGSLYINVYVPDKPTDQINRNGIHYLNKVTIHYMPSHVVSRLTAWLLVLGVGYLIFKEYVKA